ncbi:LTA synthase family protein [Maribellus sp. CM-23]|uniref:LTA synthase family protein n=1 Tax=Maribellus sp. CM-23 TaxID=2781026 RepID=UPI001F1E75C7|nr:LTA synthase family protein [Maribellus sp. CM-23]MCE4563055.1 LTA synthase family protein [Maribellus sp. CM-23]
MGKSTDSLHLIFRSFRRFASLSTILATMILIVRLYELVITSNYYNYPPGTLPYLLFGLKYDLILFLRISALLVLPFLLIAYFSQKAARFFFITFSVLLVLGNMLLLKYFSTSMVPLGADLFGYSAEEIKQTVQVSGELKILPFIFMALFLLYMVRIFQRHVYYKLKPWMLGIFCLLMLASLLPIPFLKQQPSAYNNEFSMFAATNKLNFFGESVFNHYLYKGKQQEQNYTFKVVNKTEDGAFAYIDEDFPFLRTETTPDVLSPYFELGQTPPNFVFIIVESLGRAYSGKDAYLGSFTPFLDSLTQHSLYWENCLSTSGRTFEVLPSTLASLPFGKNGFAELGEDMPDHISLISLLKKEAGYKSSFVYGGEAHFDNMDVFLNRQGVDEIIDNSGFGEGYEKLPASSSGFTWGYGDREIFRRYISKIQSDTTQPRVDVMLTLAMHDPFNIPDQDNYIAEFQQRVNSLKLDDKTRTFNHGYDKQFSTILYFDDALQYFFREYSQLPSFENTIFIITGDHRMPEIPIATQLDRFHVPLVIYSQMLKRAEKFSSLVTHFDITPSLVAMLDKHNIIERPKAASWIGQGLDDHKDFRNKNSYPLMRNKNEILDFIGNDLMLANGVLYQVYENMDIEPKKATLKKEELSALLENFIRKNNYACLNNKLIPDSLKRYTFSGQ